MPNAIDSILESGLFRPNMLSDSGVPTGQTDALEFMAGLREQANLELPPAQPPKTWGGELTSAFGRGVDQLQQMFYGAGGLASSWLGWEGAKDWFMRGYLVNENEIARNPASVPTFKGVHDFDTAIRYGLSAVGQLAPQMAESFLSMGVGALAGSVAEPGGGTIAGGVTGLVAKGAVKSLLRREIRKEIGEVVAKELTEYAAGKIEQKALSKTAQGLLGTAFGQVAKKYGMNSAIALSSITKETGSIYGDMANDKDTPESDKRIAATVGGLLAAIPDTVVMSYIGSKFFPKEPFVPKEKLAEASGYLTRFLMEGGKEIMKVGMFEGAQEFVQTGIEIASRNWANPQTRYDFLKYDERQWEEIIDASLQGGIGGAVLGGPVAGLGAMAHQNPNPKVRQAAQDLIQKIQDVSAAQPSAEAIELAKVQEQIAATKPEDTEALAELMRRKSELEIKLGFAPTPASEVEAKPLVNQNANLPSGYSLVEVPSGENRSVHEVRDATGKIAGRFDYTKDTNGVWRPTPGSGIELLDPNLRGKGIGQSVIEYLLPKLGAIASTGLDEAGGTTPDAQKMWKRLEAKGAKIEELPGTNPELGSSKAYVIRAPQIPQFANTQEAVAFGEKASVAQTVAMTDELTALTAKQKAGWDAGQVDQALDTRVQLLNEALNWKAKKEQISKLESQNGLAPLSGADQAQIEHLRAFYAQEMPKYEAVVGPDARVPSPEDMVAKHQELDSLVNQITQSETDPENAKKYEAELRKFFTPAVVAFLAAEQITVKHDPAYNFAGNFEGPNEDQVVLYLAQFDKIMHEGADLVVGRFNKSAKGVSARTAYLDTIQQVLTQELVHLADIVQIREEQARNGAQETLSDYVNWEWERRGKEWQAAYRFLPKMVQQAYKYMMPGETDPITIGQELPRMAVEWARTGQLTEISEALAVARAGNENLDSLWRSWLDVLKRVGQAIKRMLDLKSGNKDFQRVFNNINEVLDRYGLLVNESNAPVAASEPSMANVTMDMIAKLGAHVEYEGERGYVYRDDDGRYVLRTKQTDIELPGVPDTYASQYGIRVLNPSALDSPERIQSQRQARELLLKAQTDYATRRMIEEATERDFNMLPEWLRNLAVDPLLNALHTITETGARIAEQLRSASEISEADMVHAENMAVQAVDRIEAMQLDVAETEAITKPFYDILNNIDKLRKANAKPTEPTKPAKPTKVKAESKVQPAGNEPAPKPAKAAATKSTKPEGKTEKLKTEAINKAKRIILGQDVTKVAKTNNAFSKAIKGITDPIAIAKQYLAWRKELPTGGEQRKLWLSDLRNRVPSIAISQAEFDALVKEAVAETAKPAAAAPAPAPKASVLPVGEKLAEGAKVTIVNDGGHWAGKSVTVMNDRGDVVDVVVGAIDSGNWMPIARNRIEGAGLAQAVAPVKTTISDLEFEARLKPMQDERRGIENQILAQSEKVFNMRHGKLGKVTKKAIADNEKLLETLTAKFEELNHKIKSLVNQKHGRAVEASTPPIEGIVGAMIRDASGRFWTAGSHSAATERAEKAGADLSNFLRDSTGRYYMARMARDEGFVTSMGRFVGRIEGRELANTARQITGRSTGAMLTSEEVSYTQRANEEWDQASPEERLRGLASGRFNTPEGIWQTMDEAVATLESIGAERMLELMDLRVKAMGGMVELSEAERQAFGELENNPDMIRAMVVLSEAMNNPRVLSARIISRHIPTGPKEAAQAMSGRKFKQELFEAPYVQIEPTESQPELSQWGQNLADTLVRKLADPEFDDESVLEAFNANAATFKVTDPLIKALSTVSNFEQAIKAIHEAGYVVMANVEEGRDPIASNEVRWPQAARKFDWSGRAQTFFDRHAKEAEKALGRSVTEDILNRNPESRSRERGGYPDLVNYSSPILGYNTQPQTEARERALNVFQRYGLNDVVDYLLRHPLGDKFDLAGPDDAVGIPNAGLASLYELASAGLDHVYGEMMHRGQPSAWVQEIRRVLFDLQKQASTMFTTSGRFGAHAGKTYKVWNGYEAIKAYSNTMFDKLAKALGKHGAGLIEELKESLNPIYSKYVSGAISRPEVIEILSKLAKEFNTKKFIDAQRKTLAKSQRRNVANKAAVRMAEYGAREERGTAWAKEGLNRILKRMVGARTADPTQPTEADLLKRVLNRITREQAEATGVRTEGRKRAGIPIEQQFMLVMKNPDLYNAFIVTLRQEMQSQYQPEAGSEAAKQMDDFFNAMADRRWTDGMVESLVNEKIKDFEIKIGEIIAEHYSQTEVSVERVKNSVKELAQREGIQDQTLVDQLVADIDESMNAMIEEKRANFLGSERGIRFATLESMQKTVGQLFREHASKMDEASGRIYQWLENDLGIPNTPEMPLALTLAEVMRAKLVEMSRTEREAIVKRWVAKAEKLAEEGVARKLKVSTPRLVEMLNIGLISNREAYEALSPVFDLPPWSEKIVAEMEALGDRIGLAPNERMRETFEQQLTMLFNSQKGVRTYDMYISALYVNMLSGLSTQAVNVTANITALMGYMAVNMVRHPARIPAIIRAIVRTMFGAGQVEARETFFTGMALGKSENKLMGHVTALEMEHPLFQSSRTGNLKAFDEGFADFTHKLYRGVKGHYVGRALMAADIFFYKLAQEAGFAARGQNMGSQEMMERASDQARNDMFAMGVNPDETSATRRQTEVLKYWYFNQYRMEGNPEAQEAWIDSHREAMEATFQQDPQGILGKLAKGLETWTRDNPIGVLLIPFTRVAANVTNHMLEWTPYGMVRWGVGHMFSEDFRLRDSKGNVIGRDADIAIRSLIGTAGIIALIALLGDQDEEDPYIAVYADGPRDMETRRQMMDRGWRPNTFKVGSTYISYIPTPLAIAFSIVGRLFDDYRDGKIEAPSPFNINMATSAAAILRAATNQSFLAGLTDFMSAVDSPAPEKRLSRLFGRMASTPLVPNLIKQIDKWVNPSIQEADGFWQNWLKELPVVRSYALNSMLNVFGEPINRTQLFLPGLDRFISITPDFDPVYEMLGQRRLRVPGYSRSTQVNGSPITLDQLYQWVELAGPKIKQRIASELSSLRRMPREDAQDRIEMIARDEKEAAKKSLR